MDNIQLVEKLQSDKKKLFQEISKVIIGQEDIIEHLFVSLLCKGHVLLEGVPGLAKTLLINTLSNAMDSNEIEQFHEQTQKGLGIKKIKYIAEPILDGLAVELVYEDGIFVGGFF